MINFKKIFACTFMVAAMAVSCEKGPAEEEKKEETKPAGRVSQTFTASLPGDDAWAEGATISVFDDRYNNTYTLQAPASEGKFAGKSYAADSYRALYPSSPKANISSDGRVHAELPALLSPAEADSFEGLYAAVSENGSFAFQSFGSVVKFTILNKTVTSVSLKALSGNGLAGPVHFSFTDGISAVADSAEVVLKPASGSAFEPGVYQIPVVAGTREQGIEMRIHNTRQGDVVSVPDELKSLSGGQVVDLGEVDGALTPEIGKFVLPVHFKIPEKLLDASSDTGVGSAWPFTEAQGTSGTHAMNKFLHMKEGGFPVYWSGGEYYLNSKGGIQFYGTSTQDYFEFPTLAKGRVVSISAAFGNLPAPYVTDARGRILKGGEVKSGLVSSTLYEWKLEDSVVGEPVRFVMGHTGGQVLQFNVTYEIPDEGILNGIESVSASDAGNANFGTGKIDFSAQVRFKDGASSAGTSCAIEYYDIFDKSDLHVVECTPESFTAKLQGLTGDRYIFKAWACSENGWRVYSEDVPVYTSCLKVDFWKDGAGYNPFSSGMKSGATAASALSGTEQKALLKDCDMAIFYYAPKDGASYYIDLNTGAGCRVYSGGADFSPMTYFKFPAIPGKALREVVVTRGVANGSKFFICQDPSSPESAEQTRLSSTVTIPSGATASISCPFSSANTAYCLVFPDKTGYALRSVHAVYEAAGGGGGEVVPDDQTLNPDDTSADPSGVFDYSKLVAMGHPRVLISKEGFDDIRKKVTEQSASNRFLTEITNYIITRADRYVLTPTNITYTLDASGTRLLTQSTNAFRQLALLAYAYQVTGQTKYVTACRKILRDVCAFSDWHPSHFLDTAEMSFGVALAYDWLYYVLPTEEKVAIKNALIEYGLKAGFQYGASKFYNSDGNWNQVCNGGMLAAALAVYEKDKADAAQTIEKAYSTNKVAMGKIYSPDGNYAEGYGYWGYGTGFQALILQMLETAFGTDAGLSEVEGFLKTAGYMQFMAGPGGPFGYADGGATAESASVGMWWFAGKLNDKSLLCNEMRLYAKGNYADGSDERYLPLVPAVARTLNMDDYSSVYPSRTVWSGNGKVPVAMVHTGWKFDATDRYLGIKAGNANQPHGHMDAGTFVYDAHGKRWSTDLTRPSYATMENALGAVGGNFWSMAQKSLRWDITSMNNWFHSTISVNANDGSVSKTYPTDHYVNGVCTITEVLDNATEKGAVLDMSAPLKGQVAKATRTIKLVGGRDLVVIDEITALSGLAAPLVWHMVTPASPTASADGISLSSGGVTLTLRTVSSDASVKPSYLVESCVRPSSWTARTWDPSLASYKIVGYECTVPAGKTVTLTTTLSSR